MQWMPRAFASVLPVQVSSHPRLRGKHARQWTGIENTLRSATQVDGNLNWAIRTGWKCEGLWTMARFLLPKTPWMYNYASNALDGDVDKVAFAEPVPDALRHNPPGSALAVGLRCRARTCRQSCV